MSTRSTYGILNQDGTVTAVYCHFDGYVSGVGKELFTFFKTEEQVRALIAKGQCRSLDETRGKTEFYAEHGEELNIQTHKTENDFWQYNMVWMEYHYLFKPAENQWYVRIYSQMPVPLNLETLALHN